MKSLVNVRYIQNKVREATGINVTGEIVRREVLSLGGPASLRVTQVGARTFYDLSKSLADRVANKLIETRMHKAKLVDEEPSNPVVKELLEKFEAPVEQPSSIELLRNDMVNLAHNTLGRISTLEAQIALVSDTQRVLEQKIDKLLSMWEAEA